MSSVSGCSAEEEDWNDAQMDALFAALPRHRHNPGKLSEVTGRSRASVASLLRVLRRSARARAAEDAPRLYLTRRVYVLKAEGATLEGEERRAERLVERELRHARKFNKEWLHKVGLLSSEYRLFDNGAVDRLARTAMGRDDAEVLPCVYSELYCALHSFLRPIIEDATVFARERHSLLVSANRYATIQLEQSDVMEALRMRGFLRADKAELSEATIDETEWFPDEAEGEEASSAGEAAD